MVQALVKKILELSGPVQDEARFKKYLASLPIQALQQKVHDLHASNHRFGPALPPRARREPCLAR